MSDDPRQLFNVSFEGVRTVETLRALKRVGAEDLAASDSFSAGPHIVQLRAGTSQGAVGLVQAAVAPSGKFANFRVAANIRERYAHRVDGVNRERP